jgi:glycosyltransferase involved in cell wall biosynthesis
MNKDCSKNCTVLHINGDYPFQSIYPRMIESIKKFGWSQLVYVPLKMNSKKLRCVGKGFEDQTVIASEILSRWHRVFYRCKIKLLASDIFCKIDLTKIQLIHAHTLFSDGGVARALSKRFKIPYIVAVRNTDLNYFLRYRPDLTGNCLDILSNASKIVFITKIYQEKLFNKLSLDRDSDIAKKSVVIPNGLGDEWLIGGGVTRVSNPINIKLLYVGDFSKNKNVESIILAADQLVNKINISVTLVGGGGDVIDKILASGRYGFVNRINFISDVKCLIKVYQEHDIFVMPSFHETFGVSYIEALSQGLPIIFTKNEGVDGMFENLLVGESVDPHDVSDIARKIEKISNSISLYRKDCVSASKRFSWALLAGDYDKIYKSF